MNRRLRCQQNLFQIKRFVSWRCPLSFTVVIERRFIIASEVFCFKIFFILIIPVACPSLWYFYSHVADTQNSKNVRKEGESVELSTGTDQSPLLKVHVHQTEYSVWSGIMKDSNWLAKFFTNQLKCSKPFRSNIPPSGDELLCVYFV